MTRQIARMLRNNATRPEREAWALLKELRSEGIAVRRQHPVGRYVVDFAIMRDRIAIEIDGPLHETDEARRADRAREQAINQFGWRIIRFTPKQVEDADNFITAIRANTTPSPRGEGAGGGANHQPSDNAQAAATHSNIEDHPTPQPPPLTGRGSFAPHLQRRTRANRRPPGREKP
jgi:very-short-patch-repair endonuclease